MANQKARTMETGVVKCLVGDSRDWKMEATRGFRGLEGCTAWKESSSRPYIFPCCANNSPLCTIQATSEVKAYG